MLKQWNRAIGKVRSLLKGSVLSRKISGATHLWFNPEHDEVTRDYYLYVVNLLARAAKDVPLHANIVFGAYPWSGHGNRRTYRIDFQIEHTLVKPGGRGSETAQAGCIPVLRAQTQTNYLVRLQDAQRLAKADAIVEYSRPNLVNVGSSGHFPELAAKMHYIAPLVWPAEPTYSPDGRDLEIITLFGNPGEPRRKALLEALRTWNPACQNVRGRFSDIRSIYKRTKILVNIRQTDHHDTLEELRVLPALLCGVIVISEDVPLREEVPYKDFVLWAPISDIPELVEKVRDNYMNYFENIFSSDKFKQCLLDIDLENTIAARSMIFMFEK